MAAVLLSLVAKEAGTTVTGLLGGVCAILLLVIMGVILSVAYNTVWAVAGVLLGVGLVLLFACIYRQFFRPGSGSPGSSDTSTDLPMLPKA